MTQVIAKQDNCLTCELPSGDVRLAYFDGPYNTQQRFTYYDDRLPRVQWEALMSRAIERAWTLLRDDGSIWASIDDREVCTLRAVLDRVAGQNNYIATIVWQKRYSRENRAAIGDAHEYILVYAKNPGLFKQRRNKLPLEAKQHKVYKNPNNDPRGPWRGVSMVAQGQRPSQLYTITAPNGQTHVPPVGSCWRVVETEFQRLAQAGLIYFGKAGTAAPTRVQYLRDIEGIVPWTWWPHEEVGHTDEAKKESQTLFGRELAFDTPKPERLIQRILEIATNPGDLVLDMFAGSGTTGAVAHRLERRAYLVEQNPEAYSLIQKRLEALHVG